jgi:predicted dienelactone hydrolase
MKSAKLLSIGTYLLVVFALLAGCVPVPPRAPVAPSAPAETPAEAGPPSAPRGLRPDAPPYAVRGPYAVGVRDFTVEGTQENERSLTVSVWYPALNPEGAKEAVTYTMGFPTNENPNFPIFGRALADAVPDLSGGPYPLVVYSHGAYTFRQQVPYLVEHLASRGFVVMAADHEDNWGTLFTPTLASEVSRPADIKRQLGLATELTAGAGALAGMIDTERVAVAGYSFGGEIAMEMGGARLNLVEWQHSFCTVYPEEGDCVAYRDHLGEIAALAGLGAVPEGLWPDWSDPRVDVIVALAPNCTMFGGGGLENVRRPILFAVGSKDSMAGPGIEYRHCFETLPSTRKTRVVFENADHLLFMSACAAHPGMAEAGFFWACSDPVWDMERAHDLINHFVTAFLLAELKGDAEAAKALAPENAKFPGIKYQTTGYGAGAEPQARLDAPTVAKVEALVRNEMAGSQVPGMSVCIMKDG